MGFTLGGQTAIDVGMFLADCEEQGLPTDWTTKANAFTCPLGCSSGVGHVLLTRESLDKLPVNTAYDLEISSPEGSVTIKNLHIVKAINLAPTATGVKTSPYLVEIADRRRLWQTVPINKAYNLRSDAVGDATTDHFEETLNAGALWTWATMIEDLWGLTGQLGDWPGLPNFTPDGTPENWAFYGHRVMDALCMVLDRISCALRLDPTTELYSIVQIGVDDPLYEQKIAQLDNGFKIWSTEPQEETISLAAANVRVHFRHEQGSYSSATGLDPWYTIDIATNIIGAQPETYVNLFENLTAQYDDSGTLQNSAALSSRAVEQVADYVRTVMQTRMNLTYRGIHAGDILPGSQVKVIRWEQTEEGYKTIIARFPGVLMPGLAMAESSPQEQFEGIYESPGTLFGEVYAILPAIREWLLKYSPSFSGITVEEEDGSPSYSGVSVIQFDQDTGFVVSQPVSGTALVQMDFASATLEGIVSTTTQTFAGVKTFNDRIVSLTGGGTGFGQIDFKVGGSGTSSTITGQYLGDSVVNVTVHSTVYLSASSDTPGIIGGASLTVEENDISGDTFVYFTLSSGVIGHTLAYRVWPEENALPLTGQTGTLVDGSVVSGGIITTIGAGGGGTVTDIEGQPGPSIDLVDVDDTNVTLAISAAANVITFTMGWAGTLSTARGGLGGNFSASTGVLTISAGTVSAVAVLPEASGGTNQSTYATGDILYASAANVLSKRTIGTTGQVLTVSGTGVPEWATPASGGITSLGGQTGATQTFADVDDTNVTLAISSSVNVHTFTMGWTGTLAHERGGLEADVSAYDGYVRIASGATSNIKVNFAGTTAPTANEDSGDGYAVGSQWFDTTNDKAYVCLDATAAAAVWTEITSSGGVTDHGALTGLGDDDHTQYVLLAGRSSPSQTIYGSPAAGGHLTLGSTSHATKGGGVQLVAGDHLEMGEVSAPGTPGVAKVAIYAKSDGFMYSKDDSGTETLMSSGPVPTVPSAASQAQQESGTSTTTYVSPGRQHYHPSAVKGFCAWDGDSGGSPSVLASYNVTSLSDGGAGNQTINWATDFSTANYGLAGLCGYGSVFVLWLRSGPAAGTSNMGTGTNTAAADADYVGIFAMGDQ